MRLLHRSPGALVVDLVAVATIVFLVAPLIVIVPMSFSSALTLEFPPKSFSGAYYSVLWNDSVWWRAARNTFVVGAVAAILATITSLPAAYALTQMRLRGQSMLRALVMLPLVTPLIVIAVASFSAFAPLRMHDNVLTLAIVHAALGMPLAFLAINASLEQFDVRQMQAARSLGAPVLRAFWRVMMPAIAPGLVTGALFAFVYSFNEVVVALFLGGRNSETLPRKMFEGITLEIDPVISAVATTMMVATTLLFAVTILVKRRASAK